MPGKGRRESAESRRNHGKQAGQGGANDRTVDDINAPDMGAKRPLASLRQGNMPASPHSIAFTPGRAGAVI